MYRKRFLKLKLIIVSVFICFILICCSSSQGINPDIQKQLASVAMSSSETESFTALLLLSNLALKPEIIQKIEGAYEKENDPTRKLFILYVLSKRTQERKYIDNFIALYPSGEKQNQLIDIIRNKTNYISISSPLQNLLAIYAKNDREALKKLLSGYQYADGADLEILEQQIKDIYAENESLFLQVIREENIKFSEIGIQ
ncbi:MAG: hypothetical protein K9J85_10370 [Desulfobacteraceae bacterium]|nr:hypothetical protein [Desulfobacteraceae bacterium]